MEGFVKKCVNYLNDDKKPVLEKFWKLEKCTKEDMHYLGAMEVSKSEAIWGI